MGALNGYRTDDEQVGEATGVPDDEGHGLTGSHGDGSWDEPHYIGRLDGYRPVRLGRSSTGRAHRQAAMAAR